MDTARPRESPSADQPRTSDVLGRRSQTTQRAGGMMQFSHYETPAWAQYLLWFQGETLYKLGIIMASQDANTAAIEAVVAQLGKAKDEIVTKIAAVQTAADAGQDL